jgi:hypothetical protein
MKKFKQFINEQNAELNQQDAGLSSLHKPYDLDEAEVKARINAVLGHTASSEFMNPKAAIAQMEAKLALVGLSTEGVELDISESGEVEIPFKLHGDVMGKTVDTPHDEIEHETKVYNLKVRFEQLETGSFKVYGELV